MAVALTSILCATEICFHLGNNAKISTPSNQEKWDHLTGRGEKANIFKVSSRKADLFIKDLVTSWWCNLDNSKQC